MKVTVKDLFESFNALQALSNVVFDNETLAWKIGRLYDAAETHFKRINRHHAQLVRKHGREVVIQGQKTDTWVVDQGTDAEENFQKEWTELGAESVNLIGDHYTLITHAELCAAMPLKEGSETQRKPLPLTPISLGVLSRWLLTDGQPENKS